MDGYRHKSGIGQASSPEVYPLSTALGDAQQEGGKEVHRTCRARIPTVQHSGSTSHSGFRRFSPTQRDDNNTGPTIRSHPCRRLYGPSPGGKTVSEAVNGRSRMVSPRSNNPQSNHLVASTAQGPTTVPSQFPESSAAPSQDRRTNGLETHSSGARISLERGSGALSRGQEGQIVSLEEATCHQSYSGDCQSTT